MRAAILDVQIDTAPVNDERIGCLLVGPGLGDVPQVLTLALTSKAPKVLDADAIAHLGEPERLKGQDAILTPHEGEFRKLFGELPGTKPARALEAARRSGAVILYKGPDTIVAAPDGRVAFAPRARMAGQRRHGRRARGRSCRDAGARLAGLRSGIGWSLAARPRGGNRWATDDC